MSLGCTQTLSLFLKFPSSQCTQDGRPPVTEVWSTWSMPFSVVFRTELASCTLAFITSPCFHARTWDSNIPPRPTKLCSQHCCLKTLWGVTLSQKCLCFRDARASTPKLDSMAPKPESVAPKPQRDNISTDSCKCTLLSFPPSLPSLPPSHLVYLDTSSRTVVHWRFQVRVFLLHFSVGGFLFSGCLGIPSWGTYFSCIVPGHQTGTAELQLQQCRPPRCEMHLHKATMHCV